MGHNTVDRAYAAFNKRIAFIIRALAHTKDDHKLYIEYKDGAIQMTRVGPTSTFVPQEGATPPFVLRSAPGFAKHRVLNRSNVECAIDAWLERQKETQ